MSGDYLNGPSTYFVGRVQRIRGVVLWAAPDDFVCVGRVCLDVWHAPNRPQVGPRIPGYLDHRETFRTTTWLGRMDHAGKGLYPQAGRKQEDGEDREEKGSIAAGCDVAHRGDVLAGRFLGMRS